MKKQGSRNANKRLGFFPRINLRTVSHCISKRLSDGATLVQKACALRRWVLRQVETRRVFLLPHLGSPAEAYTAY